MLTQKQEEWHQYEIALQRQRLYHMLQDAVNKGLLTLPPDINFQLDTCRHALQLYYDAVGHGHTAN